MTVTIGRAAVDDLYDLSVRGRRVSFTVDIEGSDIYGMQALRQQLAGLVDNRDEEVVPFTWSEDSSLDGFYRVVSVDVPSADLMLSNGFVPEVAVELEQIPGFAKPTWETTAQSVLRTNSHGITAGTPAGILGVLIDAPTWAFDSDLKGVAWASRPVESGVGGGGGGYLGHMVVRDYAPRSLTAFRVNGPAADFYKWGCKIEVELSSGSWYAVVGRQVPQDVRWRITNGLVRLTAAKSGTPGKIEIWSGAAWESRNIAHWGGGAQFLGIGEPSSGYFGSLAVLRNSHEQVTVQTVGLYRTFTYTVARGWHHVEFSHYFRSGGFLGIGLDSSHAAACTALTGAVRATSNDANGNRIVFGTADTYSSDLVNGAVWPTIGGLWPDRANAGFVGFELDGSSALTHNAAQQVAYQFYSATAIRQRVVIR